MNYAHSAIEQTPRANDPRHQHLLDTYASETNKVWTCWNAFSEAHLAYRPHPKSSTVGQIMEHQLLSERRFFAEFLGLNEPPAAQILPPTKTPRAYSDRLVELALPRLNQLAPQNENWWHQQSKFFDVDRERIWIFWRRILHTAHHRTQLGVYQRLLDLTVEPIYGPTADVSWSGADPTLTIAAAERK